MRLVQHSCCNTITFKERLYYAILTLLNHNMEIFFSFVSFFSLISLFSLFFFFPCPIDFYSDIFLSLLSSYIYACISTHTSLSMSSLCFTSSPSYSSLNRMTNPYTRIVQLITFFFEIAQVHLKLHGVNFVIHVIYLSILIATLFFSSTIPIISHFRLAPKQGVVTSNTLKLLLHTVSGTSTLHLM